MRRVPPMRPSRAHQIQTPEAERQRRGKRRGGRQRGTIAPIKQGLVQANAQHDRNDEHRCRDGGELLKEKNVLPDIVFTSLLRRAINTANIALDAADRLWIPVERNWRLNERHYGALQGKNKTEIRQEYGDEKFMLWRRSYATPPPEIDPNDEYAQNHDPRYTGDPVPEAECLADVVKRVEPYFKSAIEPELKAGKTVLIAAHGNSLRAIVKMLDNLSEEEIAKVNIPTAIPLLYELDEDFKPIKPRGEYLDPEAAAAGAAAVAAQGQK